MAKTNPKMKNNPNKIAPDKNHVVGKKSQNQHIITTPPADLLGVCDNYFAKHLNTIFWISLILTCFFGFLLFDLKVSMTGDDSTYILRANDFVHHFVYPSFQGPLYPLLISPLLLIFGINLPLLKLFSFLCMAGQVYFIYRAFKGRISATILSFVLLFSGMNGYLLYYASQTYSEALFMLLQAILFCLVARYFIVNDDIEKEDYKTSYKKYLCVGAVLLMIGLTRTIGFGAVLVLLFFLLVAKKWKSLLGTFTSFSALTLVFELLKRLLWKSSQLQFSTQGNGLMLKNYYNPSEGKETLMGYVQRLIDNSHLYLSKHFYTILGLRPDDPTIDIAPFLTFVLVVLLVVAFYMLYRKNKMLLFTGLYVTGLCCLTFVALQKSWDQSRLIVIYVPYILIFIFSGLWALARTKSFKGFQIVLPLLLLILFFTNFKRTTDKTRVNKEILSQNLKGDVTYGLTPDWVNYIKMSKWASLHLPKEKVIACRKPAISTVYGNGRFFYGIFQTPVWGADTVVANFVKRNDDIVVMDNNEFEAKKVSADIFYTLCQFNVSMIVTNSGIYTLYQFPKEKKADYIRLLNYFKLNYSNNLQEFYTNLKKSNTDCYVENADYLLSDLVKNNVGYILMASLRKYAQQKTEYIVDTIHRYVYFIQLKYPTIFRKVYQVGDDNDEPAWILEVNPPQLAKK